MAKNIILRYSKHKIEGNKNQNKLINNTENYILNRYMILICQN